MAGLFLAWANATNLIAPGLSPDLTKEAVPNLARGVGTDEYASLLKSIFKEAERVLKPNGRMLLTFHNSDVRAWASLAAALRDAGFWVCGLAAVTAENRADHSKRNPLSFTSDLIIECRHHNSPGLVTVALEPTTEEEMELIAAGLTLADYCSGQITRYASALLARRPKGSSYRIHDGFSVV